ncbi:MAG: 16S rRNA (guanine(527)-N(7))-methyltransferase RsmG [Clostridia bacterium]|nr:16S rRNA (guanine(527)-N(7))-methyltransferase RsmG [Clostridia bacterium]
MYDRDLFARVAAPFGVEVTPELAEKLDIYARLLVEWNQKMNLTAITDPQGIAVKHFADSLTAAALMPAGEFSLIDVGTGAGFPGVPLALYRSDCRLTLLDSLNKRLTFLDAVCRQVGLNATLIHARAEEGGRNPDLRERYDVACARAVANLPVLSEYCLPFVKVGGRFIALKGPDADRERADAARGIGVLGGRIAAVTALTLPATPIEGIEPMERRLVRVDKVRPTSATYPRHGSKIAKKPL